MDNENRLIIGKIYHNKYGDVKVIEKVNKDYVIIEFVDENIFGEHTRKVVQFGNIIHSSIKDEYRASIYGVACKGNAITTINKIKRREYIIWFTMINHCYKNGPDLYNFVCQDWLCYETFLQDIIYIESYNEWFNAGPDEYYFVKMPKCKIYSPDTVAFVPKDLARLIQGHGGNFSTEYLGVSFDRNTFKCMIGGDTFGYFTNVYAAANMFNYVATYRNYPARVLNDVPFMTLDEIRSYRTTINSKDGNVLMCRSLDRKTDNNFDIITGINPNRIWNNHGDPIRVINDHKTINGTRRVDIEFINENIFGEHTIVENVSFGQIVHDYSAIIDYYKPRIYDVACKGNADYHDEYGNRTKEYILWISMISRCYNIEDKDYYRYGGLGVRVCNDWLCFERFIKQIPLVDGYIDWKMNDEKYFYHLDKDIKQPNTPMYMKTYSVNTCTFVTRLNNNAEKHIRLAEEKQTHPVGVYPYADNKYYTMFAGVKYGIYDDINAATNMYNLVATANGVNPDLVNKVPIKMDLSEIRSHRVDDIKYKNGKKVMYKVIDYNK